jgi:hypothetical protein
MNKADFKDWIFINHGNFYHLTLNEQCDIVNQFAEDFAEKEAIEFARYISKNFFKIDVNKYIFSYEMITRNRYFTIEQLYQKFKDEN